MNFNFRLLLVCSIFVLLFQHASGDTSKEMSCCFYQESRSNENVTTTYDPALRYDAALDTIVTCRNEHSDERPLDEIFQNISFSNHNQDKTSYTFDQIANSIKTLIVSTPKNVSIGGTLFARMKKLEKIKFEFQFSFPFKHLDISPGTFTKNKLLTDVRMPYLILTNNTLKAFEDTKDTVRNLEIENCLPTDIVFELVSQFTKLKHLRVECLSRDISQEIRLNFPKGLESIKVKSCNLQKITATMFRNMSNLKQLDLSRNNILEIENGAFDDLVNLSGLDLTGNNITRLPGGLFDKTPALERVVLCGTGITDQGTDRLNFTYCPKQGSRPYVVPGR